MVLCWVAGVISMNNTEEQKSTECDSLVYSSFSDILASQHLQLGRPVESPLYDTMALPTRGKSKPWMSSVYFMFQKRGRFSSLLVWSTWPLDRDCVLASQRQAGALDTQIHPKVWKVKFGFLILPLPTTTFKWQPIVLHCIFSHCAARTHCIAFLILHLDKSYGVTACLGMEASGVWTVLPLSLSVSKRQVIESLSARPDQSLHLDPVHCSIDINMRYFQCTGSVVSGAWHSCRTRTQWLPDVWMVGWMLKGREGGMWGYSHGRSGQNEQNEQTSFFRLPALFWWMAIVSLGCICNKALFV